MDFKMKSQLRRVMSDRALKIVKCSQNKASNLKLVQSSQDINNSSILNNSTNQSQTQVLTESPLNLQAHKLATKFCLNNNNSTNKITLQPIKTFEIKDRDSLISHIKHVYEDTIKSNGSIIFATQSIINSIMHYSKANNLNEKETVEEILTENLFQTNRQLSVKYQIGTQPDEFQLEAQMQILLQIENLIINSTKIDDDGIWEIANSIRWLNQIFKEKFKIERFLFGEIYANYYQNSPDFILNLMEELGYDKEENLTNPTAHNYCEDTKLNISSNDDSSTLSVSLNNSDLSESLKSEVPKGDDDVLDEALKKKKLVSRFPCATLDTSRSIMVQKKRSKLKIRSPYKSPNKSFGKWLTNTDSLRRSPRIKERGQGIKRSKQYTITDTPVHKQTHSRIAARQQKIIKRISFQHFSTTTTVIPDTPDKNEMKLIIKGTPSPKKHPRSLQLNLNL